MRGLVQYTYDACTQSQTSIKEELRSTSTYISNLIEHTIIVTKALPRILEGLGQENALA